jgi:hypothetical protein
MSTTRVHSSSGLHRSNHFIAPWRNAVRRLCRAMTPILQCTRARKSNAAVFLGGLSVARMGVSVSRLSRLQSCSFFSYWVRISLDIGDFLKEEIKGPAKFSCKSRAGCKFEEPAMNDLIDSIFGDAYITLQCKGGECLHYSQVPGYIVRCLPIIFYSSSEPFQNHFSVHRNQIAPAG